MQGIVLESEVAGVEVDNCYMGAGSRTPEPVGVDTGASFRGPSSTLISSGSAAYNCEDHSPSSGQKKEEKQGQINLAPGISRFPCSLNLQFWMVEYKS